MVDLATGTARDRSDAASSCASLGGGPRRAGPAPSESAERERSQT